MTAISFNDDWAYRRPVGPFGGFGEAGNPLVAVRLPHDALRDAQRRPDVPGKGSAAYFPAAAYSYIKSFTVPSEWAGKIVRIEIQGAFRNAQVFLNDDLAGNRADGYARFVVDLTPFLRLGAVNELRIEVRSGQDSRWYPGTGLHRPVFLHVDQPVHVVPDGVTINTVRIEDDQAVVDVVTTLTNAGINTRTSTVETTVLDPEGVTVEHAASPSTLAPGETAVVRHRLYIPDPQLWSPDSPSLHTARIRVSETPGEDVDVVFGIRTVTVDPRKGLRINGEPVVLRGACVHHDNGPLGAAAIGRAEERRIELLRKAGFNAIRSAHNPVSVAMLEACDRLGVMVMDEAFDMWTRFKSPYDYASDFPQWWEADLEAMVSKDRNHPSVIMYSIGNEIVEVGTPHGARWARKLAEHVRHLDPTRLVTNGVNLLLAVIDEAPAILAAAGGNLNELLADPEGVPRLLRNNQAVAERTEESSAALDVLGLNYAETRYDVDHQLYPQRVIVGSETFPALIGKLWPMVLANDNVIGDFTWTGWDYLGEVGIGAIAYAEDPAAKPGIEREYPFLTAMTGDLDITGWRRPVSYYREIVYGLRTEPYIAVHRPEHHDHTITQKTPWGWSDSVSSWTWPRYENAPVTVEVYSDADEIALLLNNDEVARRPVGERWPMISSFETVYRAGKLTAVGYRNGVETSRTTIATAQGATALLATTDRAEVVNDDDDLAFITVELRALDGTLITAADRPVTVTVQGAGVLAGMCSANPRTDERFDASTWHTFDGRALAVIRPAGIGQIDVTITADGLEAVSLMLTSLPPAVPSLTTASGEAR